MSRGKYMQELKTVNLLTVAQLQQIEIATQMINRAQETYALPLQLMQQSLTMYVEPLKQMQELAEVMAEPMRQMYKFMEIYSGQICYINKMAEAAAEPIRRMQEAINNSPMLTMVAMAKGASESQQKIIAAFTYSPSFSFLKVMNLRTFPTDMGNSEIIDAEIKEETTSKGPHITQQVKAVAIVRPQALVPIFSDKARYREKSILGLKEIAGRSFRYKRKTLKKLSYRNCEGRLLSLFLISRDLFVSDNDICEKLHIPDGRAFSWVLRNLKRKFRDNDLLAIIERRCNPDGYILIDISYLQ